MKSIITIFLDMLFNVLQVFLVGIASWAAMWVGRKFQSDHSNNLSQELEKNLQDIIRISINKAKLQVENPNTSESIIDLKNDIINKSVEKIKTVKPKTVKKLKLTDEEIENKIKSYIFDENNSDIKKVKDLIKDYNL